MTDTVAIVAPAGSCPSWCAYGPCRPLDDVHMSRPYTVPADPGHVCSHKTTVQRRGEPAECDIPGSWAYGVSAQVASSGGDVLVRLFHGVDELPMITLEAAAELGQTLQNLVVDGRRQR